ncbi:hypothetical protein FRC01_013279 [Tulasnella sp. 417]|nr:hypothetical protein FRC01_013279 [Tulasnella sp. 417]
MTSLHQTPPSLSWRSRIVSGGLEIVDHQLEKASSYVEQINHALRSVPKQTELIDFIDNPELRLSHGSRLIEAVRDQIHKGLPVTLSLQNAAAITDVLLANFVGGMDDRKMLLEYVLVLLSRLPSNSRFSKDISDKVITLLYNDLPHPPSALVGSQYRYRSADGSGNNIYKPDIGKVQPPKCQRVTSLLIFILLRLVPITLEVSKVVTLFPQLSSPQRVSYSMPCSNGKHKLSIHPDFQATSLLSPI